MVESQPLGTQIDMATIRLLSVGLNRLFPLEFNGMSYTDVEQWNREVIEKTKDTIIVKDNLEPKELENE